MFQKILKILTRFFIYLFIFFIFFFRDEIFERPEDSKDIDAMNAIIELVSCIRRVKLLRKSPFSVGFWFLFLFLVFKKTKGIGNCRYDAIVKEWIVEIRKLCKLENIDFNFDKNGQLLPVKGWMEISITPKEDQNVTEKEKLLREKVIRNHVFFKIIFNKIGKSKIDGKIEENGWEMGFFG